MEYFIFDQEACACFYNFKGLEVSIMPQFFASFRLQGGVQSPLSPEDSFFQCQVDEIYNHNLGPNCQASVDDLPYDYRETFDMDDGERHDSDDDDHSHLGQVDECPGRVIHQANPASNVVLPSRLA